MTDEPDVAGDGTVDEEAEDSVGTALVEVSPGTALVFGQVPEGLELAPFNLISGADRTAIVEAVAKGSSVLNLGTQLANGLAQAQGLVRLAPQTIQAMQAGAEPIKSGGYFIGVLRHGGQFSNQVRWLPATGTQAAGIAASMGSALAMISIQIQLSELTSLVQENISLTETVLRSVRHGQWAELTGLERAIAHGLAEANAVGRVTELIWQNVAGHEPALEKQRDLFRYQVTAHVTELAKRTGHTERRQYIEQSGEAILLDVHSLLLAQKAWFEYQALRAGRARITADSNPDDAVLLDQIVSNARREYDQTVPEMGVLMDRLNREISILADLPGKRTMPFSDGRRSATEVAEMARALLSAIEHLSGSFGEGAPLSAPDDAVVVDAERLESDLRILRWHLDPGEELVAFAHARSREVGFTNIGAAIKDGGTALAHHFDGLGKSIRDVRSGGGLVVVGRAWARGTANGVNALMEPGTELLVAVTQERVLVADLDEFRKQGAIRRVIPNDDIKFVRPGVDESTRRARIDVTTTAENFSFGFPRGSSEDEAVQSFVGVLEGRGDATRRSIVAPEAQ